MFFFSSVFLFFVVVCLHLIVSRNVQSMNMQVHIAFLHILLSLVFICWYVYSDTRI